MSLFNTSLVWFRRDLRTFDQAALHEALSLSGTVHCVFIFDREILDPLQGQRNKADRRVDFIHRSLAELDAELRMHGGGLIVRHAHASTEIPRLAAQLGVEAVFSNEDYEPAAVARDATVAGALMAEGRRLILCKDQVIFEKSEVLTQAGRPFSVFTPYKNAWMKTLMAAADPHADHPLLHKYAAAPDYSRLAAAQAGMPSLADLGFETSDLASLGIAAGMSGGQDLIDEFMDRIRDYDSARNFPAVR
ncbi:MAG: deoxyribodipyrimidine photo-lyase, partial [Burkholderiaceae bacterium]